MHQDDLWAWKAPDLETYFDKRMMNLREHFQPGKVLSESVTATTVVKQHRARESQGH